MSSLETRRKWNGLCVGRAGVVRVAVQRGGKDPTAWATSQGGKRVVERPEHGGYGGVVQGAGTQLLNYLYLAEAGQVVPSWKGVSIRSLARPVNTWESYFTLTPRHSPGTSPPSLTRSLSCRLNWGKDKDSRGLKPALYPLRRGHRCFQGRAFCSMNPRSRADVALGLWVTFVQSSRPPTNLALVRLDQPWAAELGVRGWEGLRPPALACDGP